jgi:hypothetical protein
MMSHGCGYFLIYIDFSLRFATNPAWKKEVPSIAAAKKSKEGTEMPNLN